jgi:hypothetical protein
LTDSTCTRAMIPYTYPACIHFAPSPFRVSLSFLVRCMRRRSSCAGAGAQSCPWLIVASCCPLSIHFIMHSPRPFLALATGPCGHAILSSFACCASARLALPGAWDFGFGLEFQLGSESDPSMVRAIFILYFWSNSILHVLSFYYMLHSSCSPLCLPTPSASSSTTSSVLSSTLP